MQIRGAILIILSVTFLSCAQRPTHIGKGSREDRNGWIVVHLEGPPREIGFQHGALLADEIDEALRMMAHFLKGTTHNEWSFYRNAAERMFWPKLEKEYQEEIEGIVEGLRSRGKKYDRIDLTALNGWMELAWYYVPSLAQRVKPDSLENRVPGNCSAFIATGSYTADGKIVMGHNAWVEYIVGERWNIVADIVPARGHRIMMDTYPGFIHSGDDFAMNSAGLLITETTITQFNGFNEGGTPEFGRARTAIQYAKTIEEFQAIMTADNNGGYANTWLIGDLKTNEIGKLDLGLKNSRLWRTNDGVFVGSNFPTDEKLLVQETKFDPSDSTSSANARKKRWQQVMAQQKGKITAEVGMGILGDHVDANLGSSLMNRCALCGHVDRDSAGVPQWSEPPFYPSGAVQGKVTSAALAKDLKFWARMGHPCGADFIASDFLSKHPEFRWQEPYLHDMRSNPWTLFEVKR
jgi:hypothetical protein